MYPSLPLPISKGPTCAAHHNGGSGCLPELNRASFASKETAGRKTPSAIGKPEGKRQKGENPCKECSLERRVLRQRAWRMNGGEAKRDCAKLYELKWLLAERGQMLSSINGP